MTLFEKIIAREIPATIVYEDDLCIAFKDINPCAPLHTLLVPKKPLVQLSHATEDDAALLGHLMLTATKVAALEGLGDAYRLVINNGAKAGMSVPHLHLHLIPRRSGDVMQLLWRALTRFLPLARKRIEVRLAVEAQQLREALRDV